ncbi:MAG: hypothetical protein JJLCMIEE_02003 [Acidimicrobiales bacterium]|nr:MAG: histidine phosphatase family protein [Actinomycetota bacterium]MBV6508936.1 hypothetical protein [Acidimicrobiales bacterium]RIK08426.1 MAG: histidine phosphatase family protein [Acidobacteriota bacterium]
MSAPHRSHLVHLVRHGQAAHGWVDHPDPGLSEHGCLEAEAMAASLGTLGRRRLVTSPLLRCRQTARALEDRWGVEAEKVSSVAEVPAPDLDGRMAWLQEALRSKWSELPAQQQRWRQGVLGFVRSITEPAVVVTHFVAINVVVGAALGREEVVCITPGNCSVTTVEISDGQIRVVELPGGQDSEVLVR